MIKNTDYTVYFQPKEYHFSLDSIVLPKVVAEHIKNRPHLDQMHFLDLCSGCGIIGLELSVHVPKIQKIDFLEVQELYQEYFEKNKILVHPDLEKKEFNFLNLNYEALCFKEYESKYDLIISNPPYFFKDEGVHSPNIFKNRCRFFIDSTFPKLIEGILNSLNLNGEAYILVRNGTHHGRDIVVEIQELVNDNAIVSVFSDVRSTNVIQIIKKSLNKI